MRTLRRILVVGMLAAFLARLTVAAHGYTPGLVSILVFWALLLAYLVVSGYEEALRTQPERGRLIQLGLVAAFAVSLALSYVLPGADHVLTAISTVTLLAASLISLAIRLNRYGVSFDGEWQASFRDRADADGWAREVAQTGRLAFVAREGRRSRLIAVYPEARADEGKKLWKQRAPGAWAGPPSSM